MPANRDTELGGIWADGASLPPAEPVSGVTYKQTALDEAGINDGWPYAERVDSAFFNEMLYRVTKLLDYLEKYGVMTWHPTASYDSGAFVLGSNGHLYRSLSTQSGHDPISSPTYWEDMDLPTHAALTAPHSATRLATANRLMLRDASGRAQVAAPSASADIARKAEVDTHAGLTAAHSASSAATPNRIVTRDSSGRTKMAAPSAADDVAIKATVDALGSTVSALGARFLQGRVFSGGTWLWNPNSLGLSKAGTGQFTITHNIGHTNYSVFLLPLWPGTDYAGRPAHVSSNYIIQGSHTVTVGFTKGAEDVGGQWTDVTFMFLIFTA